MAGGRVTGVGRGTCAGGWMRLSYREGIAILYVHHAELSVEKGEEVAAGAMIDQLEMELGLDGFHGLGEFGDEQRLNRGQSPLDASIASHDRGRLASYATTFWASASARLFGSLLKGT